MSQIPRELDYGVLGNMEYEWLVKGLYDIARCGHPDFSQIDWCGGCKARFLVKTIVESR